jgi:hypothetical protein
LVYLAQDPPAWSTQSWEGIAPFGVSNLPGKPPVVAQQPPGRRWSEELLVREKAHTREGDAIAAARRRPPMVALDTAVEVTGIDGADPFVELSQLASSPRQNDEWGAHNAGWWTSVQWQKVDFVIGEPGVDADKREGLNLGLGYKHPVERVGVMRWQPSGGESVIASDDEDLELAFSYGIEEVVGGLKSPGGLLDRDLPRARCGHTDIGVWIGD